MKDRTIIEKLKELPLGDVVIESAFGYDEPEYIKGLQIHSDDLKSLAIEVEALRQRILRPV